MILRTNVGKTVDMFCRPFQAAGTQSEAAYGQRMMGEGPSYQDWQKGQVQFRECGEEMASVKRAGHRKTQHGKAVEDKWSWTTSDTW